MGYLNQYTENQICLQSTKERRKIMMKKRIFLKSLSRIAVTATALSLLLVMPVTPVLAATAIHDSGLFTTALPANDDLYTGLVNIGFGLNFYGNNWNQLYVNNNGNVTFTQPLGTYTPFGITGGTLAMLAPFFADVDTRAGDVVTYGANTLGGKNVFGVNWIDVGYYSTHTDKLNSFQLIITDRSDISAGDFDFQFNYDEILWETGDASSGSGGMGGQSASAGWTNGAGDYYAFVGSLVNGALIDGGPNALTAGSLNSNVLGQYNFSVRGGNIVPPSNDVVPEPASLLLLGFGLLGLAGFRRKFKK